MPFDAKREEINTKISMMALSVLKIKVKVNSRRIYHERKNLSPGALEAL